MVVGGGSAAGKNKGKSGRKGESEVDRGIRDCEERYDRLLEMFGEDEIGREKVKGLHRERKLYVGLVSLSTVSPSERSLDRDSSDLDVQGVLTRSVHPHLSHPQYHLNQNHHPYQRTHSPNSASSPRPQL